MPPPRKSLPELLTDEMFMSSCAVRAHDKRIACDEEFSDSEDEAEGQGGGRRNAASFKKAKRTKTEEDKEKEGEEKKAGDEKKADEKKGITIITSFYIRHTTSH